MAFVLDASVAASWLFPDEDHPDAREAWRRAAAEDVVVPLHWWFEVRNILLVGERRQRISEDLITYCLERLSLLPIIEAPKPSDADVFQLARRRRLTLYDAVYLELAQREDIALATLDLQLAAAAREEGVDILADQ
jgi:predicted nucleic acid-binding protein